MLTGWWNGQDYGKEKDGEWAVDHKRSLHATGSCWYYNAACGWIASKKLTHFRNHHHFLGYNVVQDEGEGHLIIIVQQGVDGFLQPHQSVLLLCAHKHGGQKWTKGQKDEIQNKAFMFMLTSFSLVSHRSSMVCATCVIGCLAPSETKTKRNLKTLSQMQTKSDVKGCSLLYRCK